MGRHHAKLLENNKIMLEQRMRNGRKDYLYYLCMHYVRNSAQFVSSFVTEK